MQSIFLLGEEEHQVMIWWEVAVADQLWINPIDPHDCLDLAVPGDAPPSE